MNTPITTASSALPAGTRLGEFELTGVVGEGGFGIVYAAKDTTLDRIVAIKEYLPAAFALRNASGVIEVRLPEHQKTFEAGLASFINEARMLAKFSHPGLVEVYRFWEGNGTAYMAMRYYRGVTLRETIRSNPDIISEEWLCQTLDPILLALRELHAENCYHRDIAPDNIMVLPNGRSVLMDFGAARRIIGGMTRALTTVLKPGYAPIEQYSDDGSMKQGAWTDIYAIGGLLYHAMSGKVPVQAISRMMSDPLKDIATIARQPYSENLCRVVMKCLAVMPEHRYQSIDELRAALGWVTTPVSSTVMHPGVSRTTIESGPATVTPEPKTQPGSAPAGSVDPLADLLGSAAATAPNSTNQAPTATLATSRTLDPAAPAGARKANDLITASRPQAAKASNLPALLIVGAVLLIALAAGAYLLLKPGKTKTEPPPAPVLTAPVQPPPVTDPPPRQAESAPPPAETPPSQIQGQANPSLGSVQTPAAEPVRTEPAQASANQAQVSERTKSETGTLRLVVSNGWANVIVNGEERGTVPPLTNLKLAPGQYTIELRNPAAAPVVRTIEIVPGKTATLRHAF